MTEEEAKIVLGIKVLFIALILLELMLVNWDTCSRIFYPILGRILPLLSEAKVGG